MVSSESLLDTDVTKKLDHNTQKYFTKISVWEALKKYTVSAMMET